MSEISCGCPTGLGYRFHRHPCARTGVIEPLSTTPTETGDGHE